MLAVNPTYCNWKGITVYPSNHTHVINEKKAMEAVLNKMAGLKLKRAILYTYARMCNQLSWRLCADDVSEGCRKQFNISQTSRNDPVLITEQKPGS